MPTSRDPYERMEFWEFKDNGTLYMNADQLRREVTDQRATIATLEQQLAKLRGELAAGRWVPVEYADIYTPDAKPIRPDYEAICEDWHEFYNRPHDTADGYEYAVCRRVPPAAGGEVTP